MHVLYLYIYIRCTLLLSIYLNNTLITLFITLFIAFHSISICICYTVYDHGFIYTFYPLYYWFLFPTHYIPTTHLSITIVNPNPPNSYSYTPNKSYLHIYMLINPIPPMKTSHRTSHEFARRRAPPAP